MTTFLEARQISRSFGGIHALSGVDLDVRGGEIHGLVGANGAGKSTFIRILAGATQPNGGTIRVAGEEVAIRSPHEADRLGLAFLHQELSLVDKFSVLENMSLGLMPRTRLGVADRRSITARARAVADEIGLDFDLDAPVNSLTVAQRWLVALGRSLMRKARLIALDEPTAAMSAEESEKLFGILRKLTADGIAILYVSHRLDEIVEMCATVTAFQSGKVVGVLKGAEITKPAMIRAITGGHPEALVLPAPRIRADSPVVLEAHGLSDHDAVKDVSLQIRAGEIVGLAGLVGSGRTELAMLLAGGSRVARGQIVLDGRAIRSKTPRDAVARGIGLVPEERRSQGLFLNKSVAFNINIASLGRSRIAAGLAGLSMRRYFSRGRRMAEQVDLRPLRLGAPVRDYSGGNQQKVVLGRVLLAEPKVLILDEPTKGVDVGAKAQIHSLLGSLADDGMALLVISSEFEELLGCHRVLVMSRGSLVAELTGAQITADSMLRAAYEVPTLDEGLEK